MFSFHARAADRADLADGKGRRAEDAGARGRAVAYFRIRENRTGTHVHLHAYSIGANVSLRPHLHTVTSFPDASSRGLGCLLAARSFYRKVEILVTILFRDLTRESRLSFLDTFRCSKILLYFRYFAIERLCLWTRIFFFFIFKTSPFSYFYSIWKV